MIVALCISAFAIAQKSIPEGMTINAVSVSISEKAVCPDFTITTTDGVVRNLYTELNAGKSVLLDQFYTTCGYCQMYAPIIDLTGRCMFQHQAIYHNGVFVISANVASYPAGAYIVKMFSDNEVSQVFRFTVE